MDEDGRDEAGGRRGVVSRESHEGLCDLSRD